MNRGFRVQYSSALGPYEGGLHFGGGMSSDGCKVRTAYVSFYSVQLPALFYVSILVEFD